MLGSGRVAFGAMEAVVSASPPPRPSPRRHGGSMPSGSF